MVLSDNDPHPALANVLRNFASLPIAESLQPSAARANAFFGAAGNEEEAVNERPHRAFASGLSQIAGYDKYESGRAAIRIHPGAKFKNYPEYSRRVNQISGSKTRLGRTE